MKCEGCITETATLKSKKKEIWKKTHWRRATISHTYGHFNQLPIREYRLQQLWASEIRKLKSVPHAAALVPHLHINTHPPLQTRLEFPNKTFHTDNVATASLNSTRFWYPDHHFLKNVLPPNIIEQTTFWSISWWTNSCQSSPTSKYRPNFLSAPLAIYSCVSATLLGCQQPSTWSLCFWGRRCQCPPSPHTSGVIWGQRDLHAIWLVSCTTYQILLLFSGKYVFGLRA